MRAASSNAGGGNATADNGAAAPSNCRFAASNAARSGGSAITAVLPGLTYWLPCPENRAPTLPAAAARRRNQMPFGCDQASSAGRARSCPSAVSRSAASSPAVRATSAMRALPSGTGPAVAGAPPASSSVSAAVSGACQRWTAATWWPARRSSPSPCSSSTMWKLVPPKPNEEMAARRLGRSGWRIQGRASELTYSGPAPGCRELPGSWTLIVGGSTLWCRAMASLIIPAAPAAALVWPICDFTLPTAAYALASVASARTEVSAFSSVASPTAVPVPCASNSSTLAGEQSASSYARRSATIWPSARGA